MKDKQCKQSDKINKNKESRKSKTVVKSWIHLRGNVRRPCSSASNRCAARAISRGVGQYASWRKAQGTRSDTERLVMHPVRVTCESRFLESEAARARGESRRVARLAPPCELSRSSVALGPPLVPLKDILNAAAASHRLAVRWPTERNSSLHPCPASTEGTFGRGDLCVCPLGGLVGAPGRLVSHWSGVPKLSPQGQTLRAPLLRGTSVPHWPCADAGMQWEVSAARTCKRFAMRDLRRRFVCVCASSAGRQ